MSSYVTRENGSFIYWCAHCDAEIFRCPDNTTPLGRVLKGERNKHLHKHHPEIWTALLPVEQAPTVEYPGTHNTNGHHADAATPSLDAPSDLWEVATGPNHKATRPLHHHVWACLECGKLPSLEELREEVTRLQALIHQSA